LKLKRLTDLLKEEFNSDVGENPLDDYKRRKYKVLDHNRDTGISLVQFEDEPEGEGEFEGDGGEDDWDEIIDTKYDGNNDIIKYYPNFSVRFYKFLKNVFSEISAPPSLVESIYKKIIKNDMLYIDLTDDIDNNVSYLPKRYLERLGDLQGNTITIDEETKWNNKYRVKTKIGRILNKVGFDDSSPNNIKTIDTFISEFKRLKGSFHFEFVEGDGIAKWYLCDNYEPGGGSLNNSCMRYDRHQHKFKFYDDIPEIVKMLIMKYNKDSDKILGRALIWKTNKGMYMDRIYTVNDADRKLFEKFAKEHNWMCHSTDQYENLRVALPIDKEDISIFTKYINFFKKKKRKGESIPNSYRFPYMDTFLNYYYEKGILSNKLENKLGDHITLRNH